MKSVLLGGLDPTFRDEICGVFESQGEEYKLCVLTSLQSLEGFLKRSEGDMLILDLDFNAAECLEWLALLAKMRSAVPVVAIGESTSPDVRGYDKQYPDRYFPFVRYLQKPVEARSLFALVASELMHATWGVIQGISLPTLLQMLNMEQKTCTMRVTSGRRQGFLYLKEGQIINARYRRMEGMEAARLLVLASSPKIEIDSQLHDATHVIDMRLEELLMQAAQSKDEGQDTDEVPGEDLADMTPVAEVGKWDRTATSSVPVNQGNAESLRVLPEKAPPPPTTRMPRPVGVIVWISVAALLGLGGWFLIPRMVEVDVRTAPAGAEVSLDGNLKGLTPLRMKLPSPVKGLLSIAKPGHKTSQRQLSAEDRALDFTLEELPVKVAEPPVAKEEIQSPAIAEVPEPEKERPKSKKSPAREKSRSRSESLVKEKAPEKPGSKSDIFDQIRKQKE